MKRIRLFRRREVWLPTIWGSLLLLLLATGAAAGAMLGIYPFLAQQDPLPSARVMIVEGWLSHDELRQAAATFRARGYERIITTGGPVDGPAAYLEKRTYAELAADYLRRHGLQDAAVHAVPAPPSAQHRTYISAVMVREWAAEQGLVLDAFDVFSAGVHARRSRMLYEMAFGENTAVGVLAARPHEYDINRWWGASTGAKAVVGETVSLAWTICCFRPAVHVGEIVRPAPPNGAATAATRAASRVN